MSSRLRSSVAVSIVLLVILAVGCSAEVGPSASPPSEPGGASQPAAGAPGSAPTGTAGEDDDVEPWSARPGVEPVGQTVDGSMVTSEGRTRTWHLYVPTTLPDDRPVPLLVALHGGTGWGEQFQRSSGFDGIAEANGFLVVFPDGVGVGPTETMRTWNGGTCCGPAARDQVDDVAFVSMLVDELAATHDIDPDRVYAAGHSNGAVLSIRLACELSDQIVAVGFQAGTMSIDRCDPAVPVSMLHLHGAADENVPPQGGRGTRGISGVTWNPALDGLRTIAAAESCPDPVAVTDADHPDLAIQRWSPCAAGTTIEYVLVPGADHAWMGGPRQRRAEPTDAGGPSGAGAVGFDSSEAIWAFLAAHPRS